MTKEDIGYWKWLYKKTKELFGFFIFTLSVKKSDIKRFVYVLVSTYLFLFINDIFIEDLEQRMILIFLWFISVTILLFLLTFYDVYKEEQNSVKKK